MSEKFTPTPSSYLNNMSLRKDIEQGIPSEERKYNVLEAQEAAYAAKPFMDTATDLYDTYKSIDNYDYMEDVVGETNLGSLVAYAEKRAYNAAGTKSVPELTHAEKSVIEAYQAEKELLKSEQAIFDSSDELMLSSDGLMGALDAAYDRRKLAKDSKEADKWQKMEAKLKRYGNYLDDIAIGNNDTFDVELSNEFSPNRNRASVLLEAALRTGELKDVDTNNTIPEMRSGTRRIQELAEMNSFLAGLYPKSGEKETGYETPAGSHEPHYNLVETIPEAEDLIYSNPDYLTELIDESEAYAKFSADKVDAGNAVISSSLKTMGRDLPEVRRAVQTWRDTEPGMSFKRYIEAVTSGDVEVSNDQLEAAQSAKMMLRNTFWRESSMARRMAKKIAAKSEVSDVAKAFVAEYFNS